MTNNDKYIIVDIINKKFFLDVNGNVKVFNDYNNALLNCGIYELENAWVCPLIHNHIEDNQLEDNQLAMIKKQNDKQ
jgi:hypothetical protein